MLVILVTLGATVVSSTLDAYVASVAADGLEGLLPVVTKDLADTWIWGVLIHQ